MADNNKEEYFYILLKDDLKDSAIKLMKENSIETTDENVNKVVDAVFPIFKERFSVYDYNDYIQSHMTVFVDNGDIVIDDLKKIVEVE